jgi:hypothetical protein
MKRSEAARIPGVDKMECMARAATNRPITTAGKKKLNEQTESNGG